eukprot:FR743155.1.p1 GENE.FR743155.1~~FR743155.1.p1  ORF type:complete len:103 (+),score=6.93 FR743155.1:306-614(+)
MGYSIDSSESTVVPSALRKDHEVLSVVIDETPQSSKSSFSTSGIGIVGSVAAVALVASVLFVKANRYPEENPDTLVEERSYTLEKNVAHAAFGSSRTYGSTD